MHTNHLTHLNIKPGHVLYSTKIDKWIVIDFGISEDHEEDLRQLSQSIDDCSLPSYGCTPSYASPLARKSSDMTGIKSGEHNPFKSDMFSLGLILLEMCAMQPFFNSLPLNRNKVILDEALKIFFNFSGQHLFKEESYHAILDFQALLEWEEADRMNVIQFSLNFNLPCLFSAFSLPPDLFNKIQADTKERNTSTTGLWPLTLKGKSLCQTARNGLCTKGSGLTINHTETQNTLCRHSIPSKEA